MYIYYCQLCQSSFFSIFSCQDIMHISLCANWQESNWDGCKFIYKTILSYHSAFEMETIRDGNILKDHITVYNANALTWWQDTEAWQTNRCSQHLLPKHLHSRTIVNASVDFTFLSFQIHALIEINIEHIHFWFFRLLFETQTASRICIHVSHLLI